MYPKRQSTKLDFLYWHEVCIKFLFPKTVSVYFFSPCSGLVISGYSKKMFSKDLKDKSLKTKLGKAIIPYKKFKKMYKIDNSRKFEGTYIIDLDNSFLFQDLHFFMIKIMTLNWIWDLWGFISMQRHLTESPRIEQPSLWTSCQLLEAPWDSSLGSLSSVEWRLYILESRSSSKSLRIDNNISIK